MKYILITATLVACNCFADDSQRGRLPDGTAFRTDAQGNQIVDYIAELENSVDYLNQRVVSLEDELKEKEAALERKGQAALQERTIVAPPVIQRDPADLKLIAELRTENQRLSELNASIGDRDKSLELLQDRLEAQSVAHAEQLSAKEREIATLREELADRVTSVSSLNSKVEDLEIQLSRVQSDLKQRDSALAEQTKAAERALANARPSERKAALSMSNMRAFESGRANVQNEITRVRRVLAQRQQAVKEAQSRPNRVSAKFGEITASNGMNLNEIEKALRDAKQFSEFSSLRRAVKEIESRANDDIQLIERLGRVR